MGRPQTHPPSRLRQLPNAITLARLAALPALLAVLIAADGTTSVAGGAIFGAVGATDLLDGWLARRLGAESRFGRIADPLADRLLVAVGLVGVLMLGRVHPAGPAILLARDAILVAAFPWLLARGVEMRVDLPGKISSALTMAGTGGVILIDQEWVLWLFWTAVAVALATFLNYAARAWRSLRTASGSTAG